MHQRSSKAKYQKQYGVDDFRWWKCNTEPRKTSATFASQEQMIETRAWKKIRGLIDDDKCQLCGEHRETVQYLLAGCKKLAGSEYIKRHDNTRVKLPAVKWAIENRLLNDKTRWYAVNWERGKVIKNDGKKLYWD